ncbi:hypothetical protein EDC04DRAFT_2610927 [Pisolithus marmoratus]|nr:hypothetical protein EDC04DRAFT_2610927 [Pisolithus marmoratus]
MDHTLKESVEWYLHVQHEVLSLERILSTCQQQDLKMGMSCKVLADRIAEIDVFKIYPEEVDSVIPKQMPQQWWVDGPGVTTGLGIQLVTELIKEATEFFQDMETFFPGAILERIKELDEQIQTKGQELYHYKDHLTTIEALTELELVLQGNWSDTIKQRDRDRKQVIKQW